MLPHRVAIAARSRRRRAGRHRWRRGDVVIARARLGLARCRARAAAAAGPADFGPPPRRRRPSSVADWRSQPPEPPQQLPQRRGAGAWACQSSEFRVYSSLPTANRLSWLPKRPARRSRKSAARFPAVQRAGVGPAGRRAAVAARTPEASARSFSLYYISSSTRVTSRDKSFATSSNAICAHTHTLDTPRPAAS